VIDKITNTLKRTIPEGLTASDLIFYVLVITACYLLFQQADLFHTISSSYAYLNGHLRDFYDYNYAVIAGEGAYLPLIYIIFAIWNLPLKVFGVMHDVAANGIRLNVAELAWAKLLIVIFYFAATYVIFLIGKTITGQSQKAKYLAVIFAASPIAIFAAFIFGQYDIVGVFLMMMGFYFYVRRDLLKFSIFFSLAISLKMFPLIVFIPLLLLAEKRILPLIKYGIIALAATALQIVVYYPSASFRQNIFYLAGARVSTLAEFSLSTLNSSPYLIIFFTILCIYAYLQDIDQATEQYRTAISISLLSFALLFSTIDWNPQWLIMIIPFFALSYLFIKDPSRAYLLDILGMFSFTYIVVNQWVNNADVNMLLNGIFRSFFAYIPLLNYQLFPARFTHIFMGILFVYLFSPLLIQLFQRPNPIMDEAVDHLIKANNYLRARFYVGVSIFVIPSLFCALAPRDIARKIDPAAYSIPGLAITQVDTQVGNINKNISIKQSFIAENANLFRVNVQLSTWARVNDCEVTLALVDDRNNTVASQKIDCKKIVDNAYYGFDFEPIKHSKGTMYYVEVKSNGTSQNSITAWKSSKDVYQPGKLYKNGKEDTGDLSIALFYEK
jgi:Gpi18-like mannosyltransferase